MLMPKVSFLKLCLCVLGVNSKLNLFGWLVIDLVGMLVTLTSLTDTEILAKTLLQHAPSGTLLLLLGPLGAGKTTLVQALGRVLDSSAQISSPTYTLIHEYPTPAGVLVHIDAYRLGEARLNVTEALLELGLDDYLERARLVAVEWGEDLLELFPDALVVKLSFGGADDGADNSTDDSTSDNTVRRALVMQGDAVVV